MKHFRRTIAFALALALLCALGVAQAAAYNDYYTTYTYDNLIGAMEIVDCASWTSLRIYPDSTSTRLARVPLGAVVTNCYYQDDKYTYCEYQGIGGYILNSHLAFIYGPVGSEYPEDSYLGNMQITNCQTYASLRDYPSTSGRLMARVPLGDIVTNVFYHNEKFSFCMYGDVEGYILNSNLAPLPGGEAVYGENWIGDAYIVNVGSWASLRERPDTTSARLAKVPKGQRVTNCYSVDDRFACCTYNGVVGYILLDNLGW